MQGDPVAADDEQRKHGHDDRRADQTKLFADDGEDEIVVLFGQEEELLPTLAESYAEQAARADGKQALADLVALVTHPLFVERVEPDADSARVVGDKSCCKGVRYKGNDHKAGKHPVVANAADVHHHRADAKQQHHAGKVRLQSHENGNRGKNSRIREDPFAEGGHSVSLF